MEIRKSVFTLAIFIIHQMIILAQADQTHLDPFSTFVHIGSDDGLSNLRITAIHQDPQGYVWIGTEGGLCRYDGYQIMCFQNDPSDSESISDNIITTIANDKNGQLWIGTTNGLNLLDRKNEKFTRYYHIDEDPNSLPANHILKIATTNENLILVESLGGYLSFFDPSGKNTQHIDHETSMQPYYRYHALVQASESDIWFGGRSLSLHHYDIKKQELTVHEANIITNGKRENDYAFIFQSSKGKWYVGGLDGFYNFNPDSVKFERIFGTSSYDIQEDRNGFLWVGTGSGLARYNPHGEEITFFRKHPNNPNSLIDNNVNSILIDRNNNIWAGTSRGISLFTSENQRFQFFFPVSDMEVSPTSSLITALYEDDQGQLWIGTEDRGISIWDEKNQTIRHLSATNSFLLANNISAFYKDSQGDLWIGLWSGMGFHRYNKKTQQSTTYRFDPETRKRDWYNGFLEDSNGDLWLAFWGASGLKKFDREKGLFLEDQFYIYQKDSIEAFRVNPDTLFYSLSSRLTTSLAEDNQGNLWVGTSDGGLNKFCLHSKHIQIFTPENSPVPSINITVLYKDKIGNIWIGTDNGISCYNAQNQTIITDKEINRSIRSIIEDENGHIWLGTTHGLVRYCPSSGRKWYYSRPQGLLTNEFNKAAIKRKDGRLAFGTPEGLITFHPKDFPEVENSNKPIITWMEILGEHVRKFFNDMDTVILSYKDHYVTFGISCLNYKHPPEGKYFFHLRGLNDNWIESVGNTISFSNLKPGNYQLYISTSPIDTDLNLPQLVIRVKAAFWQTTLFKVLIVLLVIAGIIAIFYNYVNQLTLRNKSAQLEQRLLLSQMNPHFIYNSLSAIQNFIYKNHAKEAGNYLSDFSRLMRNILENSRSEWVSLKKELDTLELYLRLQKIRFPEKLHYQIITAPEIIPSSILIPPMLIQPFAENAIEHGIMHKEGPGNLIISLKQNDRFLEVMVMDDGIGIEAAQKLQQLKPGLQRSFATVISLERIAGLRKSSKIKANIDILDRYNYDGESGTVVIQRIPFKHTSQNNSKKL